MGDEESNLSEEEEGDDCSMDSIVMQKKHFPSFMLGGRRDSKLSKGRCSTRFKTINEEEEEDDDLVDDFSIDGDSSFIQNKHFPSFIADKNHRRDSRLSKFRSSTRFKTINEEEEDI